MIGSIVISFIGFLAAVGMLLVMIWITKGMNREKKRTVEIEDGIGAMQRDQVLERMTYHRKKGDPEKAILVMDSGVKGFKIPKLSEEYLKMNEVLGYAYSDIGKRDLSRKDLLKALVLQMENLDNPSLMMDIHRRIDIEGQISHLNIDLENMGKGDL